jgi:HSP20 family protein
MNYVTVKPRRNKRSNEFLFPHFGNILNEMMRTSVSDIVSADTSKIKYTVPAVNVKEMKDQFILEMAVPGLGKKDIDISIEEDKLIISSETEKEETKEKYALKEFNYSKFKRSFTLTDTIDRENINATFKNGILTITLTKKEEEEPKKVKIS